MPGDAAGQLSWHLSGGLGTTDSDLSLGGARSNAQIRHIPTTVGANGAAGDTRVYLAAVAAGWADVMIYFRDGNAGGFSTKVTAISTGSGWVDLLDPLPTSIAIGDAVWSYSHNYAGPMPFKDTTALESALGFTEYIGLYITNAGGALSDFRFWIEDLNPGPVAHEIAGSNDTGHTLVTIPNQQTAPDLSTLLVSGSGRFQKARCYADGTPEFNLSTGVVGFWLKRVASASAFRRQDHAVAIVGEGAGGVFSKLIMQWDTIGFSTTLSLSHAPTVYLRGGARFKATVIGDETGLPAPDVPVGFSITSGPGTLSAPPAPGVTDENGQILGRYAAPTDVGEIDQTVIVEAQA